MQDDLSKTSVIGLNCSVLGKMNDCKSLVIIGSFTGEMDAGEVLIRETGMLDGNIRCDTLQNNGHIIATSLTVQGDLLLLLASKLTGDVTCGSLVVEKGAQLNAKIINSGDGLLVGGSQYQPGFKAKTDLKLNKKESNFKLRVDESSEEKMSKKPTSVTESKLMKKRLSSASYATQKNIKSPETPIGTGETNRGSQSTSNNDFKLGNQRRGAVVLVQKQNSVTVDKNENPVKIEKISD